MRSRLKSWAPALATAAAVAALTAAVMVTGLALSIHGTSSHLRETDRRFVASERATRLWRPAGGTAARIARGVLDVEDDFSFRDGVARFRLASLVREGTVSSPLLARDLRVAATAALERHDHADRDRRRRSQTANLLGILAFASALEDSQQLVPLVDRTLRQFRRAIIIDPRNDTAKRNLEFMLRLLGSRETQISELLQAQRGQMAPATGGRRGAGFSPPGGGY